MLCRAMPLRTAGTPPPRMPTGSIATVGNMFVHLGNVCQDMTRQIAQMEISRLERGCGPLPASCITISVWDGHPPGGLEVERSREAYGGPVTLVKTVEPDGSTCFGWMCHNCCKKAKAMVEGSTWYVPLDFVPGHGKLVSVTGLNRASKWGSRLENRLNGHCCKHTAGQPALQDTAATS